MYASATAVDFENCDNIDQLKLAYKELVADQRANLLYESLLATMSDGFAYCRMIYDANDEAVDFTYLAVNDAFSTLTGLTDVIGKRVSEVIPGFQA